MNTESRNPKTMHIDTMSTQEMIDVIQEENVNAALAVGKASKEIAAAVDAIFPGMKNGGRLFYVGCGTSGRLGVLDAAECPPTYGVSHELVVGIIAGGKDALVRASEGTEDSAEEAMKDIVPLNLTKNDAVVGISASGNAEYVVTALEYANKIGCTTVSIASNKECRIHATAKNNITAETGAEVVTGSTRMKAGTSQKLILNMLSTSLMIKLGYVYENLMINLKPTNKKLTKRMIGIVKDITGVDDIVAEDALNKGDWKIREAIEIIKKN